MDHCVRHETIGQEVVAKWPRRNAKFCTEACAAIYALDLVNKVEANPIVEKQIGGAQPHAKGHTTNRPPGDPRQPIPKSESAPTAVAEADGGDGDGDDGIVQGDGLDDMTKDALKSECESLELPVSGTKDDLIARIRDHHDAD